jgi:cytochrome d ubiquinol oxidase subunit II
MNPSFDLPTVWAFIIAFGVLAYVVLDGFDLGVGVLFPALRPGPERDRAMNSIAPVWDGNETWLVLGGVGLMAAFPLAYAIVLPALYGPIVAMLVGLILRGVSFEFRWRNPARRAFWDTAFSVGSFAAAFCQGVVLGALLQGIDVHDRSFAGRPLDWLSPFSLLTGLSVVTTYALLGATWLILKTDGALQQRAYRWAGRLGVGTVACIAAISLVTPFLRFAYWRHWFAMPNVLFAAQVPLLVVVGSVLFFLSLRLRRQVAPFLLALTLFALTFAGLGISVFPEVVPGALDIWSAAAPASSLLFLLVGAALLIPVILTYTGFAYWVFRGKVREEGYH